MDGKHRHHRKNRMTFKDAAKKTKRALGVLSLMKPRAPVFHLQEIGVVKSPVFQKAPICRAVRKGQIDRVLRLIEQKGDVNERDKDGFTPLMHATWHDCLDIVKALCAHGAETNTQNNSNNTALHFAHQRGHAEIAQLLLDNGAGPSAEMRNNLGQTPYEVTTTDSSATNGNVFAPRRRPRKENTSPSKPQFPSQLRSHHKGPQAETTELKASWSPSSVFSMESEMEKEPMPSHVPTGPLLVDPSDRYDSAEDHPSRLRITESSGDLRRGHRKTRKEHRDSRHGHSPLSRHFSSPATVSLSPGDRVEARCNGNYNLQPNSIFARDTGERKGKNNKLANPGRKKRFVPGPVTLDRQSLREVSLEDKMISDLREMSKYLNEAVSKLSRRGSPKDECSSSDMKLLSALQRTWRKHANDGFSESCSSDDLVEPISDDSDFEIVPTSTQELLQSKGRKARPSTAKSSRIKGASRFKKPKFAEANTPLESARLNSTVPARVTAGNLDTLDVDLDLTRSKSEVLPDLGKKSGRKKTKESKIDNARRRRHTRRFKPVSPTQEDIAASFRILDANNDGRISAQEIQDRCRRDSIMFKQTYFAPATMTSSSPSMDEVVQKIIEEVDIDDDGNISYSEFSQAVQHFNETADPANAGDEKDYTVFLGGACNPTTWRADSAMPALDDAGVTYYNPQVDDWRPELVAIENMAKRTAKILFFVIDGRTRGLASAVEVAELCVTNTRNREDDEIEHVGQHLVVCLCDIQSGYCLDANTGDVIHKNEAKDINRCRAYLADVAQRTGHSVHTNYDDALTALLKLCKKIKKNKNRRK